MLKKILIMLLFIAVFGAAAWFGYSLITPKSETTAAANAVTVAQPEAADFETMHVYTSGDLVAACTAEDKVFCAIERTVKCTIEPTLDYCTKEFVPNFVFGQTDDVERPSEISFKLTKIKPIAGSDVLSVYTESDCNAMWFGLCKGTVVYSLRPQGNDGAWRVENIYALEK